VKPSESTILNITYLLLLNKINFKISTVLDNIFLDVFCFRLRCPLSGTAYDNPAYCDTLR